jgi:Raf kinase inhibitor-like YbhB/YbcL family protein
LSALLTGSLLTVLLFGAAFVAACGDDDAPAPQAAAMTGQSTLVPTESVTGTTANGQSAIVAATTGVPFTLTSDAFANNANIPVEYSCDGKSSSPALAWAGAPAGTNTFALILHDPDAGAAGGAGFTHWVVYNIPSAAKSLAAGASPNGALPDGSIKGANGSGANQYTGMCPPSGGPPHHYQFTLYALDSSLSLPPGAKKADVEKAIQGHVLAQTLLIGLFAH